MHHYIVMGKNKNVFRMLIVRVPRDSKEFTVKYHSTPFAYH